MTDSTVEHAPRKVRVVLCMGEYCSLGRRAENLHRRLLPLVEAVQAEAPTVRIKLETARCLGMCGAGPNCVIYPDDRVFNKLTDADVDAKLAPALRQAAAKPEM